MHTSCIDCSFFVSNVFTPLHRGDERLRFFLFCRPHIRIDVLHIVEVFQLLDHLVNRLPLFRCHVLQIVGNTGELGRSNLEAVVLQVLLNIAEAGRLTVDSNFILFVILIILIIDSVVNQIENQLIHVHSLFLLESEDSLMVEEKAKRPLRAKIAIELVEN